MKKLLGLALLIIVLSVASAGIGNALEKTKPEYVIKLATIAPEMSGWGPVISQLKERVARETNGRVKALMYWGGVMGDEVDLIRKVRLNQIHGALITLTALNRVVPELAVLDLPFIFNNRDEAAYIMEKYFDYFNQLFKEKNVLLGAVFEVGWWDINTSKKAVTRSDLKSMTIEAIPSDVFVETFKAWGIPMVAFPPADFIPSMQTGVVEGGTQPLQYNIGAQSFTVAPYTLKLHWLYQHGGAMLNDKFFAKMPADVRQVVLNAIRDMGREATMALRESNDKITPELEKYGMIVIEPSAEVLEDFKASSSVVWDKLAGKNYPRTLLDNILKDLEEYRKIHGSERDYWF